MEVISFFIGFFSYHLGWKMGEFVFEKITFKKPDPLIYVAEKVASIDERLYRIENTLEGMG